MDKLKSKEEAKSLLGTLLASTAASQQSGDPREAASARNYENLLRLFEFQLEFDPSTGEVEQAAFNPATDTVKSPLTGNDLRGVANTVTGGYDFFETDPKTGRQVYFEVDDKGNATVPGNAPAAVKQAALENGATITDHSEAAATAAYNKSAAASAGGVADKGPTT